MDKQNIKKRIITVFGTRPEIIKLAPLFSLLDENFEHITIHTGQHFDERMDSIFFQELNLRLPDHNLGIGTLDPALQISVMMEKMYPIMKGFLPDAVIVQGDTNSALAGALTAAKTQVGIFHVESGCRSFNRKMAEEQNRIIIDHLSEILFAADQISVTNLKKEGLSKGRVFHVGNTGNDSVKRTIGLVKPDRLAKYNLPDDYALLTIHRAENTDDKIKLKGIVEAINQIATEIPVVFPIHPRTEAAMKRFDLALSKDVRLLPPAGNLDFVALMTDCKFLLSDSGGIQEEAVIINKPVLILRDETEWIRLVKAGKNILAGTTKTKIVNAATKLIRSEKELKKIAKKKVAIRFGASREIIKIMKKYFSTVKSKKT
ncbi:non-hydrolyzing UDP-N-acetylglucosamine 2-epimerase [Leptospira sp. 'Mane']|uniref:non-hydrolyzing UDP-N-acetylglucosamine 2-epimerase n=1 Tax=Leptospira sp. 'Mane' TaxID=3387407 RepID=UPI00398AF11C